MQLKRSKSCPDLKNLRDLPLSKGKEKPREDEGENTKRGAISEYDGAGPSGAWGAPPTRPDFGAQALRDLTSSKGEEKLREDEGITEYTKRGAIPKNTRATASGIPVDDGAGPSGAWGAPSTSPDVAARPDYDDDGAGPSAAWGAPPTSPDVAAPPLPPRLTYFIPDCDDDGAGPSAAWGAPPTRPDFGAQTLRNKSSSKGEEKLREDEEITEYTKRGAIPKSTRARTIPEDDVAAPPLPPRVRYFKSRLDDCNCPYHSREVNIVEVDWNNFIKHRQNYKKKFCRDCFTEYDEGYEKEINNTIMSLQNKRLQLQRESYELPSYPGKAGAFRCQDYLPEELKVMEELDLPIRNASSETPYNEGVDCCYQSFTGSTDIDDGLVRSLGLSRGRQKRRKWIDLRARQNMIKIRKRQRKVQKNRKEKSKSRSSCCDNNGKLTNLFFKCCHL